MTDPRTRWPVDRWPRAALALGGLAVLAASWRWALEDVLRPLALLAWLFLRLFVLSVDQRALWIALVIAAPLCLPCAFPRRDHEGPGDAPSPRPRASAPARWRGAITARIEATAERRRIGWDPVDHLVVRLHALRQGVAPDFHLWGALAAGRPPLPPAVSALLFPAVPAPPRGLLRRLRALAPATPDLLGRRARRERRERRERLAALLTYLEQALEDR